MSISQVVHLHPVASQDIDSNPSIFIKFPMDILLGSSYFETSGINHADILAFDSRCEAEHLCFSSYCFRSIFLKCIKLVTKN